MGYKKGYAFERDLREHLRSTGWFVVRSAGSKKPDLVAARDGKVMVIECKATKDKKIYLEREEVLNLKKVAAAFGAECIFAVKQDGCSWSLVDLKCLKETENKFVLSL